MLRDFDLRTRHGDAARIIRDTYPRAVNEANRPALAATCRMIRAGIPVEHLEARWEDYQPANRNAIERAVAFAEHLSFHVETGGGLLFVGEHGEGKSLLSYLIAAQAVRKRLATVCLTIREWVDKRYYQRHNAELFDELVRLVDAASLVVVDNLVREDDRSLWNAEDSGELFGRICSGRRRRAVVVNTAMSQKDFRRVVGESTWSKISNFEIVPMPKNTEFRMAAERPEALAEHRSTPRPAPGCYHPLSFIADRTTRRDIPEACHYCAYRTRAALCEARVNS